MTRRGFSQLYWGFLFVLIDFRLMGFDILPDFVGYLLFASGLGMLGAGSAHFGSAARFNLAMIFLSLFQVYQAPAQGGVSVGPFGGIGLLIGLAVTAIDLLLAYHLFLGVGELAARQGQAQIAQEAFLRWQQYLWLYLAVVAGILMVAIPVFAMAYLIGLLVATVALTVAITGFMSRCGATLQDA